MFFWRPPVRSDHHSLELWSRIFTTNYSAERGAHLQKFQGSSQCFCFPGLPEWTAVLRKAAAIHRGCCKCGSQDEYGLGSAECMNDGDHILFLKGLLWVRGLFCVPYLWFCCCQHPPALKPLAMATLMARAKNLSLSFLNTGFSLAGTLMSPGCE